MKKKKEKTLDTDNTGLKREVKWFLFSPNIMALILMFFYGYSIALLGTGYEFRTFVVGIAVFIALFIIMLVELITNIVMFRKRKDNTSEDYHEQRETVVDEDNSDEFIGDTVEDPSDAYRKKKEDKYEDDVKQI